ncbi:exodeoxyribonuclease V beta chain RecB domain protein [Mycobacterium xenopi 3993]|nr:exodeoxyribonuclease V beta chain RecB domain protein [Mycobacterium xenopi 3993]
MDVAATKPVDGLLGVADQDQRRVPAKCALEHLPLDQVGVLELVDQHNAPAPPHPVAGRESWASRAFASPVSRSL